MKRPWLLSIIAINLTVLIILVFVFPHLMISPGPVIASHANIATDCFACHTPLRGASSERCQTCHAIGDIGLRTTEGLTITKDKPQVAFHQQLLEQDCMACHSDHVGPKLTSHSRKPFTHAIINKDVRTKCNSCHTKPNNKLHHNTKLTCNQCHTIEAWKTSTFNHNLLTTKTTAQCIDCHEKPQDSYHRQTEENCQQCHGVNQWKPSTFNHNDFFVLDRDHNASCSTCHINNDLSRYTCFGCHEHTPANIRSEHVEEGIRNYDNCVECHRSADDDEHWEGGHRGDDD